MKICIVCPYALSSTGGVQTHIRDSAAEMGRLGHKVTIISPGPSTDETSNKDHLVPGNSRKITFNQTSFDISFIHGNALELLKSHLAENAYDIIHYHTIWSPFLPLQVFYYSRTVNIATFHDTPPDNLTGKLTRKIFFLLSHILIRRLQGVIAVSPAPAAHLASVRGKEVKIIPPCINLKQFRSALPAEQNRNEETVSLLFVGRLDRRKGIFILLQAFLKLVDDNLNVRLLIAGDGQQEMQVRDFLRQQKLENVELLGKIDEAEKTRLYARCDIFCSPALYGESFGIVLVEAMASGKPVVAAANAGYRSVLRENAGFCLSRPGDVEDLYSKLRRLVLDPQLRYKLGKWGIEESVKYDCETVVPLILDVYRNASDFKR